VAGGQERILRGRIKSVQATKKITRAMELIAASRIVKAQQRVVAAVPYSEMITEVVRDLSAAGSAKSMPLLAGRETVKNVCYVVLTADRGLCGGYNSGVMRATEGEIKEDALQGRGHTIVAICLTDAISIGGSWINCSSLWNSDFEISFECQHDVTKVRWNICFWIRTQFSKHRTVTLTAELEKFNFKTADICCRN